ncbi:ATP-dependent DNA helicase RecG [bacterium]|nr:ATP-dependent DNA helicase RecG [bacterium]
MARRNCLGDGILQRYYVLMVSLLNSVLPRLNDYAIRQLNRLGIFTVDDVLTYFPRGYQDRRRIPTLSQLSDGSTALATGVVDAVIDEVAKNRISIIRCRIRDSTGAVELVFFNQAYLKSVLKPGLQLVVSGKVEINAYTGVRQLIVAELDVIRSESDRRMAMGVIVPIYPLTQGIYQSRIRSIILPIIERYVANIDDHLPAWIRDKLNLMPLPAAIRELHMPTSSQLGSAARQRVAFDEFLKFQMALVEKRQTRHRDATSVQFGCEHPLIDRYLAQLPYRLTPDQRSAIADVVMDVQSGRAMNRLIQGDVGSGKTDVIAVSVLLAIGSGYQAAIMVPTEVLAEQHFRRFSSQFLNLGIDVVLIKGGQRSRERKQALAKISSGDPVVAIGTHALLEDPVNVPRLGLVVIDEQHRFGVMQRMKLNQKSLMPHCLYTTATPIPRSFMLTVFGDLDKTVIQQLPPGRIPPQTAFFPFRAISNVWGLCQSQLALGRQVYVVYPLVEESEKMDLESAIEGYETVSRQFPNATVGLVHGRLSGAEKSALMAQFKAGDIQILVSTTVIEVGIDVPNATVMVIVNAERFGLSQLHQLRGRVGRGADRSFCVLVGDAKSELSRRRVDAMVQISDGFELAELDLKLRGPGEILGTRQSGLPNFKVADLVKDQALLQLAHRAAMRIFERDSELMAPDHARLARWYRSGVAFSVETRLN